MTEKDPVVNRESAIECKTNFPQKSMVSCAFFEEKLGFVGARSVRRLAYVL